MAESDANDLDALEDIDNLEEIDPKAGAPDSSKGATSQRISGMQESVNLDLILDIPLNVTVELGRNKMLINELLQLGQGSVIELTKLVGEPLEVMVNNRLVARGEVVVINEKFGVRLTDIVSPLERVQSLS